jgi:hypothetical protein
MEKLDNDRTPIEMPFRSALQGFPEILVFNFRAKKTPTSSDLQVFFDRV